MVISLGSILIVLLIVLVLLAVISMATRGDGQLFPPPAALSVLWSILIIALIVVFILWLVRQI